MGIIKPVEGTWAEIKSKQTAKKKLTKKEEFEQADYSRDPIQAPRRSPDDEGIGITRSSVIIIVLMLLPIFLVAYTLNQWSSSSTNPWQFESSERQLRAEWQAKTHAMTCLELKSIVEEDPDNLPSVAWQFSYWEYTSAQLVYPSPRPVNDCYQKTGYLLKDIERCKFYGFGGCNGYFFPRDEETKTITFPHDWIFIDRFTNNLMADPDQFIANYYPELSSWHGVINGTK